MYPPRFKVSVIRLLYGKRLDTEFKVTLENNGVLAFDEVRKFPLTVAELPKMVSSEMTFPEMVSPGMTSQEMVSPGMVSQEMVSPVSQGIVSQGMVSQEMVSPGMVSTGIFSRMSSWISSWMFGLGRIYVAIIVMSTGMSF